MDDHELGLPTEFNFDTDPTDGDVGVMIGNEQGAFGGKVGVGESNVVGGPGGAYSGSFVTEDSDGDVEQTDVDLEIAVEKIPAPPAPDGVPAPVPSVDVESTHEAPDVGDPRDVLADRVPDVPDPIEGVDHLGDRSAIEDSIDRAVERGREGVDSLEELGLGEQ